MWRMNFIPYSFYIRILNRVLTLMNFLNEIPIIYSYTLVICGDYNGVFDACATMYNANVVFYLNF